MRKCFFFELYTLFYLVSRYPFSPWEIFPYGTYSSSISSPFLHFISFIVLNKHSSLNWMFRCNMSLDVLTLKTLNIFMGIIWMNDSFTFCFNCVLLKDEEFRFFCPSNFESWEQSFSSSNDPSFWVVVLPWWIDAPILPFHVIMQLHHITYIIVYIRKKFGHGCFIFFLRVDPLFLPLSREQRWRV